MKKSAATAAVAIAPVEIFAAKGRGIYKEGQIVADERAEFLLSDPDAKQYFRAAKPSELPEPEEKN